MAIAKKKIAKYIKKFISYIKYGYTHNKLYCCVITKFSTGNFHLNYFKRLTEIVDIKSPSFRYVIIPGGCIQVRCKL
ncbi:hypothetical protein ACVW0P_003856 [Mucilaginibacter sp. UYNi724]